MHKNAPLLSSDSASNHSFSGKKSTSATVVGKVLKYYSEKFGTRKPTGTQCGKTGSNAEMAYRYNPPRKDSA